MEGLSSTKSPEKDVLKKSEQRAIDEVSNASSNRALLKIKAVENNDDGREPFRVKAIRPNVKGVAPLEDRLEKVRAFQMKNFSLKTKLRHLLKPIAA